MFDKRSHLQCGNPNFKRLAKELAKTETVLFSSTTSLPTAYVTFTHANLSLITQVCRIMAA